MRLLVLPVIILLYFVVVLLPVKAVTVVLVVHLPQRLYHAKGIVVLGAVYIRVVIIGRLRIRPVGGPLVCYRGQYVA